MSGSQDEEEAACESYVPHAWKKGVCNICFKPESEHAPAEPEPEPVKVEPKKKTDKKKKTEEEAPKKKFHVNRDLIPEKKSPWGDPLKKKNGKSASDKVNGDASDKKEKKKDPVQPEPEPEPEPEEDPDEPKACEKFEPSAWKKHICRNCFLSPEEHAPDPEAEPAPAPEPTQQKKQKGSKRAGKNSKTENKNTEEASPEQPRRKGVPLWRLLK